MLPGEKKLKLLKPSCLQIETVISSLFLIAASPQSQHLKSCLISNWFYFTYVFILLGHDCICTLHISSFFSSWRSLYVYWSPDFILFLQFILKMKYTFLAEHNLSIKTMLNHIVSKIATNCPKVSFTRCFSFLQNTQNALTFHRNQKSSDWKGPQEVSSPISCSVTRSDQVTHGFILILFYLSLNLSLTFETVISGSEVEKAIFMRLQTMHFQRNPGSI